MKHWWLTLASIIRRVGERREERRNKAWMDGSLVLRAGASGIACNENDIFLACLLFNCQIAFLRRIETWMEVKEHPVARACRTISWLSHLHSSDYRTVARLNIRGSAYPDLRWLMICCVCKSCVGWAVVSFICVLIILMLLLSWRMMILLLLLLMHRCRRLCNHSSLHCGTVTRVDLASPQTVLLLLMCLGTSHLVSCISIICCGCSEFNSTLATWRSAKLLCLIHYGLMMLLLDLISHWWGNLHGCVQWRLCRKRSSTFRIYHRPTTLMIDALYPCITVEFTCWGSQFWFKLKDFG